MKAAIIAAVVFCAALIGIGVYFAIKESEPGPRTVPISSLYTARVKDGGWVRGATAATAKVTVIEYGDLQCPACKAFNPIIDAAFDQTKDTTQFMYKDYPLSIHDKSRIAAIGAEAAGRQGKFWEFEELLYNHQDSWSTQSESDFKDTMAGYASSLGISVDQFKNDLKDSTTADQIDKNVAEGNTVPVQGTPTILINGKALSSTPPDAATLVSLINAAAAGQ